MTGPATPFAARRKALGLSLEMVSEELRISVAHLRAIEAGQLDALPEGPYRAGWVRAYAAHIGLNPNEVAEQLGLRVAPPPRIDSLWAARLAAGLACVALAGVLVWAVWPSGPVPDAVPPTGEAEVQTAIAAPVAAPIAAPEPPAAPLPPALDQRVRVVVQRPGPFFARVDGAIAVDRKVRPGEEILLEGHDRVEIDLWSTDAARVVWNDEVIQPLGRQDTPRKLVFEDDRGARR